MVLINGMIQVEALDAAERNLQVMMKNTTSQFARSTTPSEQLPMEAKPVRIWQDSYLRLMVTAPVAATIKKADSVVNVPVTQYVVPGGRGTTPIQPAEVMLTADDFGITGDVALPAGTQIEIGRYRVPAGTMIQPGWGAFNALDSAKGRIYISLQA